MSRSRSRPRQSTPAAAALHSIPPWLFALAIAAIGIITFWNSLGGPFIWDDQTSIVTNPTIRHLWPPWDPLSPPRETPVAGRPLVNLTFALNFAFGGLAEAGYHVGNIAVHIGCALLLFGIVRRTLMYPRFTAVLHGSADAAALVVALLWMVHPLQSEAVDYITERSESLMALFFLLTMYSAIRARGLAFTTDLVRGAPQEAARPAAVARWQLLSVAACACGMASKETMVVAPLVVVLHDWAFGFDSPTEAFRKRAALYGGLAATWGILVALLWNTPRSTVGLATSVGPWRYLLNQAQVIARYLRLCVWPHALVLDYGLPRQLALHDVAPSAAVILLLLAATGVALVRWRAIGFLGAVFFLTLAPTSSLVPIASEVGAERRMYLPFAALATLVVVGGRAWLERARASDVTARDQPAAARSLPTGPAVGDRARLAIAVLTASVLVVLTALTMMRNAEYANPVALWTTVVNRLPHGRARMALATELLNAGQHAQAIAMLREAVADFPDARAMLGTELVLQGQHDEGVSLLRQFIAEGPTRPNRIPAHVLLAETLASEGALDGAVMEWRAVVAIAPSDGGARQNLARALSAEAQAALQQSNARRAEGYAREAVDLAPGDAVARNFLGVALASTGHVEEAIAQFREALRLAPSDQQTRNNLERALSLTRKSP